MSGEYGIACNINDSDSCLRMGSLAWIGGFNDGDWDRHRLVARTRGGRIVEKWVPTKRLTNFRVKWIPPHLKDRIWCYGTREEMEAKAGCLKAYIDGTTASERAPLPMAAAQRAVGVWWGRLLLWRKDMQGNNPARFHIVRIICVFRGHQLVAFSANGLWCRRCHITRRIRRRSGYNPPPTESIKRTTHKVPPRK